MKIARYILFCILVLMLSIFLRRPADMPEGQKGFSRLAIVDRVMSFFSGGSDEDADDRQDSDEDGSDAEDDEE